MSTTHKDAVRLQDSILTTLEKRALLFLARRMPAAVNSDHLTALGALSMLGAGLCYASGTKAALPLAVVFLALNWFGDSLDGTLARVRHHERPRYGFYVDHVLDSLGILLVIGGLVLGGYMHAAVGGGFLLAYYLLTNEIALATHAVGTFRMSFWSMGPTEMRVLLAIGTFQLLRGPWATVAGNRFLLFDIGFAAGIAGLLVTFAVSAVRNARLLYRLEPLPARQPARPDALELQPTHGR